MFDRRENDVWHEPFAEDPARFRILWRRFGCDREVCQAYLYSKDHPNENHYRIRMDKTWSQQSVSPRDAKFVLLLDYSEGYAFQIKRGNSWQEVEPMDGKIAGAYTFHVVDRADRQKICVDVDRHSSRGAKPSENFPKLHCYPIHAVAAEPPIEVTAKYFDKAALNDLTFPELGWEDIGCVTGSLCWDVVRRWSRSRVDWMSNTVITRNAGWLFANHFDCDGLRESDKPEGVEVAAIASKAADWYLNFEFDGNPPALTDLEIAKLRCLGGQFFDLAVAGGVSLEKQILSELLFNWKLDSRLQQWADREILGVAIPQRVAFLESLTFNSYDELITSLKPSDAEFCVPYGIDLDVETLFHNFGHGCDPSDVHIEEAQAVIRANPNWPTLSEGTRTLLAEHIASFDGFFYEKLFAGMNLDRAIASLEGEFEIPPDAPNRIYSIFDEGQLGPHPSLGKYVGNSPFFPLLDTVAELRTYIENQRDKPE